MAQYINKDVLVAEFKRRISLFKKEKKIEKRSAESSLYANVISLGARIAMLEEILSFLNTLEVKEIQEEPTSTAYVVTRCEEHSDYVEEVFFDEDKAQEYCDQFKGNENEYARHITKVKVTL